MPRFDWAAWRKAWPTRKSLPPRVIFGDYGVESSKIFTGSPRKPPARLWRY